MHKICNAFLKDEQGASAMEYAVLASIVVLALIAIGASIGTNYQNVFTSMFTKISSATAS